MSKIKVFFTPVLGAVLLLCSFFVSIVIYSIYKEATTLKENPAFSAKSTGNCRIVNTAFALKNGYDLYLINKKGNTASNRHIVAVDKYGAIYDFSKGTNVLIGEKINDYLKRTDTYSYGVIHTDKRSDIDRTSNFNDFFLFLVDRSYFYLFRSFFKQN